MRTGVEIIPYRDGPYLVRGDFLLRDQDGQTIDVARRTVALCRCGKSRLRPFCDGTHRLIRFRAPSPPERPHDEAPAGTSTRAPGAMTAPTEKVDGPTPAATPANGNGVVTGVDGQRSSAARPGASLSPASNELRRTRSGVGRYLRRPESPEGYLAVSAAQPLVTAACEMLTRHTERGRGQAAPDLGPAETAPCLCLLRGAIAAMLPAANAPDPIVGQLASQLRLVVEHLERRTAGR